MADYEVVEIDGKKVKAYKIVPKVHRSSHSDPRYQPAARSARREYARMSEEEQVFYLGMTARKFFGW